MLRRDIRQTYICGENEGPVAVTLEPGWDNSRTVSVGRWRWIDVQRSVARGRVTTDRRKRRYKVFRIMYKV